MQLGGELAAVGTAVCWACAASFFVSAGRRMGSVQLNRLRLAVAAALLAAVLWIARGSPWPEEATGGQIWLLGASGLLGFAIGDSFYFRALVILGAGRAALLLSLAPVFTAGIARWWLGETLGPAALLGMVLVLGGLMTVLYERAPAAAIAHAEGSVAMGIVCGIVASAGAACGYVLSKRALFGGVDALSGTYIRVVVAAAAVWLTAPIQGGLDRVGDAVRDRVALGTMIAGSVCGPFAGVTLSLYALQHTQAAVATSIFACSPLLTILLGARFHRERVGPRAVLGALVAVAGVVMLFTRSETP